jgi:hypothetical protein
MWASNAWVMAKCITAALRGAVIGAPTWTNDPVESDQVEKVACALLEASTRMATLIVDWWLDSCCDGKAWGWGCMWCWLKSWVLNEGEGGYQGRLGRMVVDL